MSFINLMGNDTWAAADINARVQAMIRNQVTAEDELKAARLARKPDPDATELAFIASVDDAITAAVTEGRNARADMALLAQAFDVEAATRRLALPVATDDEGNPDAADAAERDAAQAVIDSASAEVIDLVAMRNPPAEDVANDAD